MDDFDDEKALAWYRETFDDDDTSDGEGDENDLQRVLGPVEVGKAPCVVPAPVPDRER